MTKKRFLAGQTNNWSKQEHRHKKTFVTANKSKFKDSFDKFDEWDDAHIMLSMNKDNT